MDATCDARQWCYLSDRDSEVAYGPFDSREKAIAEAKESGLESCVLSRCNWADPGECDVVGDDDLFFEELDDCTDDELRNPEEATYALKEGASLDELREMVSAWLKKNVKPTWFCCDPDVFEDVDLTKETP